MNVLEPFNHRNEIKELNQNAQDEIDSANHRLEYGRESTFASLKNLGKQKEGSMEDIVKPYVNVFNRFNPMVIEKELQSDLSPLMEKKELSVTPLTEISKITYTFCDIAKMGAVAIGASAIVGLAVYGGAAWLGSASTGIAISALSGAAKKNATLAFLGGGSKAVKGLGIAGGKLALCGVVGITLLVATSLLSCVKAKERLAEARNNKAIADNYREQIGLVCDKLALIRNTSDNYMRFIKKMTEKISLYNAEINEIADRHSKDVGNDGFIDYSSLTIAEKKTLHLSYLLIQIYFKLLTTSILNEDGTVTEEAKKVLSSATEQYELFEEEIKNLNKEEADASNPLYRGKSKNVTIINVILSIAMIASGVAMIANGLVLMGVVFFVSFLICFPFDFSIKTSNLRMKYRLGLLHLFGSLSFLVVLEALLGSVWYV